MLKNEQGYFCGLCNWVHNLYLSKIINLEEKIRLINYIKNNRPSKWSRWRIEHKYSFGELNLFLFFFVRWQNIKIKL
jgi:hypothetical protein